MEQILVEEKEQLRNNYETTTKLRNRFPVEWKSVFPICPVPVPVPVPMPVAKRTTGNPP
jgi:hypothetical protein